MKASLAFSFIIIILTFLLFSSHVISAFRLSSSSLHSVRHVVYILLSSTFLLSLYVLSLSDTMRISEVSQSINETSFPRFDTELSTSMLRIHLLLVPAYVLLVYSSASGPAVANIIRNANMSPSSSSSSSPIHSFFSLTFLRFVLFFLGILMSLPMIVYSTLRVRSSTLPNEVGKLTRSADTNEYVDVVGFTAEIALAMLVLGIICFGYVRKR